MVAGVLVLVAFVAGCTSATGKSAGTNIDDATVTASVKAKLVGDKTSNLTRVDVDTNNGAVYQRYGQSPSEIEGRTAPWQASASRRSLTASRSRSGNRTVYAMRRGSMRSLPRRRRDLEAPHARRISLGLSEEGDT
jgi:hypothetical protein